MIAPYLAMWLFLAALPLGALPLVMGLELAGAGRSFMAACLRPLLLLMPLAALLAIPVLLYVPDLYPWQGETLHGLAATWFTRAFFTGRMAGFLLVWVALALVFLTRPASPGRRGRAGFGLAVHLLIGTLAATDWVLSLDKGLAWPGFGLLLIATQCSIALSAALLLGLWARERPPLSPDWARALAVLLFAWAFFHFTQYLVIWSADRPDEIVWYQQRLGGDGTIAVGAGAFAAFLAFVVLLSVRLTSRVWLLAVTATLILLIHLFEMLWFVTPALRNRFTIAPLDLPWLGGVVIVLLGLGLLGRVVGRRRRHAVI